MQQATLRMRAIERASLSAACQHLLRSLVGLLATSDTQSLQVCEEAQLLLLSTSSVGRGHKTEAISCACLLP